MSCTYLSIPWGPFLLLRHEHHVPTQWSATWTSHTLEPKATHDSKRLCKQNITMAGCLCGRPEIDPSIYICWISFPNQTGVTGLISWRITLAKLLPYPFIHSLATKGRILWAWYCIVTQRENSRHAACLIMQRSNSDTQENPLKSQPQESKSSWATWFVFIFQTL